MHRSINITAPVITLLSPHRNVSLQVIESLRQIVNGGNNDLVQVDDDNTRITTENNSKGTVRCTGPIDNRTIINNVSNQEIRYSLLPVSTIDDKNVRLDSLDHELNQWSGFDNKLRNLTWHSVAVEINDNGPILHFLSPSDDDDNSSQNDITKTTSSTDGFSMGSNILAIQNDYDSIENTRSRLADQLRMMSVVITKANNDNSKTTTGSAQTKNSFLLSSLSQSESILSQLKWKFQEYIGLIPHSTIALRKLIQKTEKFTPILDFQSTAICNDEQQQHQQQHNNIPNWKYGDLKEIAIPTYLNESTSTDSSISDNFTENLLNRISMLATTESNDNTQPDQNSSIHRVLPGLYQLNDATKLCIRPIPVAENDQHISAPTLIFHTPNLDTFAQNQQQGDEDSSKVTTKRNIKYSKIGYNGQGIGQIMIQSEPYIGFDIRYCSRTVPSSMFCETQGSLLAGTISSLQSDYIQNNDIGTTTKNDDGSVLTTASSTRKKSGIIVTKHSSTVTSSIPVSSTDDDRHCWTEFRESLKYPQRYLDSKMNTQKQCQRIAPSQNLPYE
jgi:hypothetical protein